MDYITEYWRLVRLGREMAIERQCRCSICLKTKCDCGAILLDCKNALEVARWWREIMVMERDRENTIITDNFLYPRFPKTSGSVSGGFHCFSLVGPILTLIIEKDYHAIYGNTDDPLKLAIPKPRLGHGAYYGTIIAGKFKAMVSFRNGYWNRVGALHTLPFVKGTRIKLDNKLYVPAKRTAHNDFQVLWT